RFAAFSEQHCPLSGMRNVRSGIVIRGRAQAHDAGGADSLLASTQRRGPCDANLRAAGISFTWDWRGAAWNDGEQFEAEKFFAAITYRNAGQYERRGTLSAPWFRDQARI